MSRRLIHKLNHSLSAEIKAARLRRHWSQEDLANRIGVTKQAVSKWERGVASPLEELIGPLFTCLQLPYPGAPLEPVDTSTIRLLTAEQGAVEMYCTRCQPVRRIAVYGGEETRLLPEQPPRFSVDHFPAFTGFAYAHTVTHEQEKQ